MHFFKKSFSLLCVLLFVLTGLSGCGKKSLSFGFAIGTCDYIKNNGYSQLNEAPFVSDNSVGYIPLFEFVDALGGTYQLSKNNSDITICLNNITKTAALNNKPFFSKDDVCYYPITDFCSDFGLYLAKRGGVFFIDFEETAHTDEDFTTLKSQLNAGDFAVEPKEIVAQYCVDPFTRYTYEQMITDIDELCETYPGLIHSFIAGSTVEGRKIPVLTVGKGDYEILLAASIHGCEFITTNFLMNLADKYVYSYCKDEIYNNMSYRQLLDKVTLVIVPMINPDGVNIAQNGAASAKDYANIASMPMQGATYYSWKANANGVDLNRNFPLDWRQENYITEPSARYFCGYSAATEPEVIAIMELLDNTPFSMFSDFHTYGEKIYWIDTNSLDHEERYSKIAERICDTTGYYDFGIEDVSKFGGYLSNYAREKYDKFTMTVEMCFAPRFAEELFDMATDSVYAIGLIMAEETVKLNEPIEYLCAYVNGNKVCFTGARIQSLNSISGAQLSDILISCGFFCAFNGTSMSVSNRNMTETFAITKDTAIPFLSQNSEDISVLKILNRLGADAVIDGNHLNISFFS